jgi:hypothetical protein
MMGARGLCGREGGAEEPSRCQRARRAQYSRTATALRDLAGGCVGAAVAAGAATRCLSGCLEGGAGQWGGGRATGLLEARWAAKMHPATGTRPGRDEDILQCAAAGEAPAGVEVVGVGTGANTYPAVNGQRAARVRVRGVPRRSMGAARSQRAAVRCKC